MTVADPPDLPSNWGITTPDRLLGSLRVAENGGDVTECADALEWMLRTGRLVDRKAIDHKAGGQMFAAITSGRIDAEDNSDAGASRLIIAAAIGDTKAKEDLT